MYGVPDLEDGLRWAEATFGVMPVRGGSHPSLGTCNALLSFGDTYLEIIAPDPAQTQVDTFGSRLATLHSGGLITWAARGNLRRTRATLSDRGIESTGPVRTSRKTPAGQLLEWELLFPGRHPFGGLLPFFIDWLNCEHPSSSSPVSGTLVAFVVSTPDAAAYLGVMHGLVVDLPVRTGEPGLRVDIALGDRHISLASRPETLSMRNFA